MYVILPILLTFASCQHFYPIGSVMPLFFPERFESLHSPQWLRDDSRQIVPWLFNQPRVDKRVGSFQSFASEDNIYDENLVCTSLWAVGSIPEAELLGQRTACRALDSCHQMKFHVGCPDSHSLSSVWENTNFPVPRRHCGLPNIFCLYPNWLVKIISQHSFSLHFLFLA